jgi:hypothetical protein
MDRFSLNSLLLYTTSVQWNQVMHFLFSLLRIKGLYMFRALLTHPQEVLDKRHLVYCMRVMSVGCTRVGLELIQSCVLVNIRRVVFDSTYLLNFEITQRYGQYKCKPFYGLWHSVVIERNVNDIFNYLTYLLSSRIIVCFEILRVCSWLRFLFLSCMHNTRIKIQILYRDWPV